MSFPPLAVGALGVLGSDVLSAIWSTSPTRVIMWDAEDSTGAQVLDQTGQPVSNSIYPQIVSDEAHDDELQITQHPVEFGAAITDHAFKLPARVQIRAAWSYAAEGLALLVPIATDASYLGSLYSTLVSLQSQRTRVSLVTGKRTYDNMLLRSLRVTTNQQTENTLSIIADFQEILIATTQVVSVPPASVMSSPQTTAATINQGQTSLSPGNKINPAAANQVLPLNLGLY